MKIYKINDKLRNAKENPYEEDTSYWHAFMDVVEASEYFSTEVSSHELAEFTGAAGPDYYECYLSVLVEDGYLEVVPWKKS